MKKYHSIAFALFLVLLTGCEKLSDFEKDPSTLDYAEKPTYILGKKVLNMGYPFQISTSSSFNNPINSVLNELKDGQYYYDSNGHYNVCYYSIRDLTPNTTYYIRYYDEDILGARIYSNPISFKTNNFYLEIVEPIDINTSYVTVKVRVNDYENMGGNCNFRLRIKNEENGDEQLVTFTPQENGIYNHTFYISESFKFSITPEMYYYIYNGAILIDKGESKTVIYNP